MKKLLLINFAILMSATWLQAQVIRCGTDEHQAALDLVYPELSAQRNAFNESFSQLINNNVENRGSLIVTIPVVFHVIYNGAAQNIPDNRIYEQLDVLNKDYSRTNLDAVNTRAQFLQVAANTQIQFCLAQRTPANAPTTGIVRIPTTGSSLPSNPHTLSPEWDHTKYLNIYVGNLGNGLLGYANLPPGSAGNDKVVILYSAVGGPNVPGTFSPYHLGRTATHEVGHWLNLQHTFQGGCAGLTANNCASAGDFICDTPPLSGPHFSCPTNNPNTCTETTPFPPPYTANMVDMYENYMDYTDDACMNVFTTGQGNRMNAAIPQLRSAILASQGCVPVGINEILDPSYMMAGPNPTSGNLHVQFNFPSPVDLQLDICDLAGRVVYSENFNTTTTTATNLHLDKLAGGVYQLIVRTDNGRLVKQIVLNH